ncbi:MAG: heme ABC exporter ATP-binding protein CcmA [Anaerolineaceae bacterium]|nr:MAG: heme ABC exporter ATP-binding protein CcmA [Anaerolineaceae bacterium]
MSAIIETVDLVKSFGFLPVLRGLNLRVERGQFVALLGPNGSGKSTLMRLLAGLARPTAGVIRVGGWELPGEAAAVRRQIGLVSHKALLYETLTARENLRFFARLYSLPDADERIDAMLTQVGLKRRAHDLVRTFSRGMLQRLSIARALLHQPDVLLFDEPYTGLDQSAAFMLDGLLSATGNDAGRTIIMATHQLDRAARLAERVIILSRGDIAHDSPTAELDDLPAIYTRVTSMVTAR